MPLSPTFPDLGAIDLFASVVELGSLGRAARAHGITQPSASSRIRTLERQLGLRLLERSPTGSTPTPAGVIVAGWAEAILAEARALESGIDSLKAAQIGRLRIVASYTIAEYLLPGWLGQFLGDHPGDTVALDVANSATVLRRLERGQADLGFIETPLTTPSMAEAVVARDQLIAVVPPEHSWCRVPSVGLEELAATPLVMREPGSGTRAAFESALRAVDLDAAPALLELGSTAAVRSAVVNGNAPTVISRLAVLGELERGQLVEITIDGLTIERRLRAVWPHNRPLPPLAADLLAELRIDD